MLPCPGAPWVLAPSAAAVSAPPPPPPLSTESMSRESILQADAHAELTLALCDAASCSHTVPTEPVRRCCPPPPPPPPDEPEDGRRSVAEEQEEEEEEEAEE